MREGGREESWEGERKGGKDLSERRGAMEKGRRGRKWRVKNYGNE